eukprot:m.191558 g.191558  ORF g.191558 m.191558 type:complete len:155 (+) comp15149_c0_seq1:42-506(+)
MESCEAIVMVNIAEEGRFESWCRCHLARMRIECVVISFEVSGQMREDRNSICDVMRSYFVGDRIGWSAQAMSRHSFQNHHPQFRGHLEPLPGHSTSAQQNHKHPTLLGMCAEVVGLPTPVPEHRGPASCGGGIVHQTPKPQHWSVVKVLVRLVH